METTEERVVSVEIHSAFWLMVAVAVAALQITQLE
jgi:hypothetical protein